MKLIKYLFICSLMSVLAVSCDKGLDPIVSVSPKPDVSAPEVVINFPVEGAPVVSQDEVATITIKLVATDDVELKSVTLQLDGEELVSYTSFKDYRRLDLKYDYNSLTDGNHELIVTVFDLTDKNISKTVSFNKITFTPLDGEVLFFPFDGSYLDLISNKEAAVVGTPGYGAGHLNDAYAGATGAYLTFPTDGLLGDEFSLAFWYKINAAPVRAGIVAISQPTDPLNADRSKGFRFFRENSGAGQNIGINFGIGATEVWMNPFINVPVDQDWMHIAISISATFAAIYVNGAVVDTASIAAPIDWTGCTSMTIASGQPNFVYWEHFSDLSLYDELHMFKRAITEAEVQSLYEVK